MDAAIAREQFHRRLDAMGREGMEREIQRIHDLLARDQRETIEHAYAEFLRRQGSTPVIIMVDVLYDEFGEKVGISEYGENLSSEIQQKAFNVRGYAPIIFAYSPHAARDLLTQRYSPEQADTALQPAPPGRVKLYISSLECLSGYDIPAMPE